MPKRPPGVYKRGKTWSVVIDHGRDPATGKRKRVWHSGFTTLREAAEARTRLLRERDTGAAIDPSRQTLAEYLRDEWVPSRRPTTALTGRRHRGKVSIQTWDAYRGDLERHVIPRLGGVVLQKLTPSDLNRLYDDLERSGGRTGAGLSPKSIANIHGLLHKALGDAVKLGKVPRNVADAVEKPSAAKPAHDIWTPEQLRAFLTAVRDDRLYAMWLLFATTGMRRGEVAGLAWDDVDLLAARVRVTWTLGVVQSKPTWKPRPKSAAGERLMALDPVTVRALCDHRRRQNEDRLLAGSAWQRRQTDWRGQHRDDLVFTWPTAA
jgi:integrase